MKRATMVVEEGAGSVGEGKLGEGGWGREAGRGHFEGRGQKVETRGSDAQGKKE